MASDVFFYINGVTIRKSLIPNWPLYWPEAFTILAGLNVLYRQLQMEAFIVFYDKTAIEVHMQSVRYIE